MNDTTVKKVSGAHSPHGGMGQKYLASGKGIAMRLWEELEPHQGTMTVRDYETVGFVISGKAELELEGQMVLLEPGDSWVVPKGARHCYNIQQAFTAVEATTPPAQVDARDVPTGA